METFLVCLRRLQTSKNFEVGILWASLAVVLLFYGALIPLLPVFVQEVAGNTLESSVTINSNTSEPNRAMRQSRGTNNIIIGSLIALAQWTEFGSNIFVGLLADKIGYDVPLFMGYFIVVVSSVGFAFSNSFATLAVWRAVEGVGAAFVITSGVAIVADMYKHDDNQRGRMIALVMCGLSIGLTIGPPFGSLLYLTGKKYSPFIAIAGMTFVLSLLQLWVRTPKIHSRQSLGKSDSSCAQLRLIRDPYILMCALLIWLGYLGTSFLEGILPFHMLTKLDAKTWMTGIVFLPLNVAFAVTLPFISWLNTRTVRWPWTILAYVIATAALVGYGFSSSFAALAGLGIPIGIQAAVISAIIFPLMAFLVDTRIGETVYGTAYALANMATSASFGFGPIIAGGLTTLIGFRGSMFIAAGLTLASLIPIAILRKPLSIKQENGETATLLTEDDAEEQKPANEIEQYEVEQQQSGFERSFPTKK